MAAQQQDVVPRHHEHHCGMKLCNWHVILGLPLRWSLRAVQAAETGHRYGCVWVHRADTASQERSDDASAHPHVPPRLSRVRRHQHPQAAPLEGGRR